jgi:hypothetical protein
MTDSDSKPARQILTIFIGVFFFVLIFFWISVAIKFGVIPAIIIGAIFGILIWKIISYINQEKVIIKIGNFEFDVSPLPDRSQNIKTWYNPPPSSVHPPKIHVPQEPYIISDPTKPLQINVENAIRRFKPSRNYQYEIDYQNELYSWLLREFPVQYEKQTGSSRPDLIIKNIAIEIKGPTGNRELDTLTTKFLKYSNHYPYFIIVLFDCKFSEGHYNEIYNGILKFAPHVKIIRK